jgi:ABC-2 type transport system permease protein
LNNLYALVRNETIKIWKKKRFLVIVLIIAALVPIFTYAQLKVSLEIREQFGDDDWRKELQQKIIDYSNTLNSGRIPEEWKKWRRVEIQKMQYHLEHDIDPRSPDAVTFTREFVANSVSLFLPLMIMVIASDLVSSEHTIGTIKLLVSRPVRRWKILLSKLIALTMYVSLTILVLAVLSYLISGVVFGYSGWTMPVLTGFNVTGTEVDFTYVHTVDQWFYIMMELGLAWFACMTVACLSLMLSVLVRSTAAGMGIMLAALIAGTILTNMVSSWETAKYLFMVNLNLTQYLEGSLPPIAGMNLLFSLMVLAAWSAAALIVSFAVFTKQDILN